MVVVAPADGVEVQAAMWALMEYDGPAYLRLTRDPTPTITPRDRRFEFGRGYVLRRGDDVTVISTGVQTTRVLEAAELLAAKGVSAHVLHLPTLKPLDEEAIVDAAAKTGLVVTAEEHSLIGGLGGAVAETLAEHRPTPMLRMGIRDVFGESGPNRALLEKYGLDAQAVAREALAFVNQQGLRSRA